MPNGTGAHERKGGAEQNGLRENQARGQRPLHRHDAEAAGAAREARKDVGVGVVSGADEDAVKQKSDDANRELDGRIPQQRLTQFCRPVAHGQRAERHAAEENHQYDDLGVRRVAYK